MLKVFDSHFHICDSSVPITWLQGNNRLHRDFSFSHVCDEYDSIDFIGGIYVESASNDFSKELGYTLSQDIGDKILGYCISMDYLNTFVSRRESKKDIAIHSCREILHVDAKGSRHCKEKDFLENMGILQDLRIPFEACMKTQEIGDLVYLLERFSNLRIILNHMGSPAIESFSSYKDSIARLSKYNNFYIKLSSPDNFSPNTPIDFIHDVFTYLHNSLGGDRIVFGSNFPVSFLKPLEWVKIIQKSNIFIEIDKVFYKNAYDFYNLSHFNIKGHI